ncbi:hypothetical protein AHF37_04054 [Paragonimus kellicotti]|nr:hypothetical protein AHF37_04054 [Paragonimus kellicotti]
MDDSDQHTRRRLPLVGLRSENNLDALLQHESVSITSQVSGLKANSRSPTEKVLRVHALFLCINTSRYVTEM